MSVQRTVRLQLQPDSEQAAAISQTMAQYAACYNHVAQLGWDQHITNGVALHHATYRELREHHPDLPSQLVCSSRVKATESLKSARTNCLKKRRVTCPRMMHPSIRLDARTYRMVDGAVSMSSVVGRQVVAYSSNPHADKWLPQRVSFDSADLVFKKGRFYLHVVITVPDHAVALNGHAIGVDLGMNRPAVTSDKAFLGERRWKDVDRRYFRLKRKLQAKGTKSAKKHLKRLSGKVTRFRRDCDHIVSRRIVDSVEPGTVIVVENLTKITKGKRFRKGAAQRRLHSWSFDQLRGFIEYKAAEMGCPVEGIDPRHTSQTCSSCGHVKRSNRKSQSVFKCKACGYELNADLNAAINIRAKYLVRDGTSIFDGPLPTGLLSQRLAS